MDLIQSSLGFLVADPIVGVGQLVFPIRSLLFGEVFADVALLVLDAALHQDLVSAVPADGGTQGTAPVQNRQHALAEIQPPSGDASQ